MNVLTPEGLSTLSSLLRHVFGSDATLDRYTIAGRRDDYAVLLARLRNPDFDVVIKLAGPRAPIACPFEQTAWVHRLVRAQTTLPVANVIAADTSYSRVPWRYMIKEYVEGTEWAGLHSRLNDTQARDVYAQVAHAAAELHGIRFARFGDVPAPDVTWQTEHFVEALAERARRRIMSKSSLELFLKVLERRADLFSELSEPCLCHEDLHQYNLIFRWIDDRWRLVNILDFDSAWAGCHESDLARLEIWNRSAAEDFMRSYKEVHPVARECPERRPVYQLLWCLEYASETPRHLADTARVCAELGIAEIVSFAD